MCPVGGGDKDAACDYWQELGYCDPAKGYYDVMEEKCPVTCGLCKGLTKNDIDLMTGN